MVLRVGGAAGGQGVVAEGRDAGINMMPQENTWNGVSFAVGGGERQRICIPNRALERTYVAGQVLCKAQLVELEGFCADAWHLDWEGR